MKNERNDKSLENKLADWLNNEGYPLEFKTAKVFGKFGFSVRQGMYARRSGNVAPREIDVVASLSSYINGVLFRIEFVVECKYSVKKPWVLFSSPSHRIARSACVAQTIASSYGSAMMWAMSGDADVNKLEIFNSPEEPCFGGRQAFSESKDQFYNSLRSVTGNTISLASNYDRPTDRHEPLPESCVLTFPVIVVQGRLFETGLNSDTNETFVREVLHSRVHWSGSEDRRLYSTVDVVSFDSLEKYCERASKDALSLLKGMAIKHQDFLDFAKSGKLDELRLGCGSTGVEGVPEIIKNLHDIALS